MTVSVENGPTEATEVASAVVNLAVATLAIVTLATGTGEHGVDTTATVPQPFQGGISPGNTTQGAYIFMLNPPEEREATNSVNHAAGEPIAIFTGRTA